VDPADASGLAGALRRAIEDPALRADLVARGRRRAGEFTWPGVARRALDLLGAAAA
jgi:glycosyltransferase involved in cell wall biosynthesis